MSHGLLGECCALHASIEMVGTKQAYCTANTQRSGRAARLLRVRPCHPSTAEEGAGPPDPKRQ